jgi:hypothetical protein
MIVLSGVIANFFSVIRPESIAKAVAVSSLSPLTRQTLMDPLFASLMASLTFGRSSSCIAKIEIRVRSESNASSILS